MTDERGLSFGKMESSPIVRNFTNSRAYLIGVDEYTNGIPPLRTAVADAERLGELLEESHSYKVHLLPRDARPSLSTLRRLLRETMLDEVGPDDRVLVYFAGHGIAMDGEDGPEGYLLPEDAKREDRSSFLAMTELYEALAKLSCRHLLLILDCCFAGAFRWSTTRDLGTIPEIMHRERFERYLQDPAWQVITSAAHNQKALDVISGEIIGLRESGISGLGHSPFATALFRGLMGEADFFPRGTDGRPSGNGVITATELFLYLREHVELDAAGIGHRQTPGFWPLRKHSTGEYVHLVPGRPELTLPPAPPLNQENCPWRGLQSYDEVHASLFFGRSKVVCKLAEHIKSNPLTIVLGASGSGKSSIVKAGVVPFLRRCDANRWHALEPMRPGRSPTAVLAALRLPSEAIEQPAQHSDTKADPDALAQRVSAWVNATATATQLLIVVDQFEELLTLCESVDERDTFFAQLGRALTAYPDRLRIVITLRSGFEPQFSEQLKGLKCAISRFVVPAMTLDDYRESIEGPAAVRVLYFKGIESSTHFVNRLITDVANTPGALPLLSFTLSELYRAYLQRQADDRALNEQDYDQLGGVAGSLRNRAEEVYDNLPDDAHRDTMKRVMLRMISLEGGELTRRRVNKDELVYSSGIENVRVNDVLGRLVASVLVVEGKDEDRLPFLEPAHDELLRSWAKLSEWCRQEQSRLLLHQVLTPAALDWTQRQGGLWNDNPRLALLAGEVGLPYQWLPYLWTRVYDLFSRGRKPVVNTWLNSIEETFVVHSVRRRHRMSTILAAATTSVTGILVAAGLTTYLAKRDSEAKREVARQAVSDVGQSAIDTLMAMDQAGYLHSSTENAKGLRKQVIKDATDRMRQVERDFSGDVQLMRFFREVYTRLADRIFKVGVPADSIAVYALAKDRADALLKQDGASLDDEVRCVFIENNIARVFERSGDRPTAIDRWKRTISLCEGLLAENPGNVELERQLAVLYSNLSQALVGDKEGTAQQILRKGIVIEERLAGLFHHPKHLWFQMNLSSSLSALADMQEEGGGADKQLILAERRRALTLMMEAVENLPPTNSPAIPVPSEFYEALGSRHLSLAGTLQTADDTSTLTHLSHAEDALRHSLELYALESSKLGSAINYSTQQKLLRVLLARAALLIETYESLHEDDQHDLLPALNRSAWQLLVFSDRGSRRPDLARRLCELGLARDKSFGEMWNTLGVALVQQKEWAAAVDAFSQSINLRDTADGWDWYPLAVARANLGDSVAAMQAFERAESWLAKHPEESVEDLRQFREAAADATAAHNRDSMLNESSK